MAQSVKKPEKKFVDIGLDEGAARLTTDMIQQVINRVLKGETSAYLKAYVDTCVSCGLCSEACHYYLSHDKDPYYAPVVKVKQTIWEILKKKGKVSPEFIKKASEIAQTECDLCRRCAMYCPFGIDIADIILIVRWICYMLGVTPQYIQDIANSYSVTMNQMWIKEDEWINSLQQQEEEAQNEIATLRIPVEKEGADIMYSIISTRPEFRAQFIYKAAVIMDTAGVNWTMPATPGPDNSDMTMYTGDNEIMGRVKKTHFETAMRLKVKKILMSECDSIYDIGNKWLGWKWYPIEIINSIEFYYELLRDGKISIAKKFEEPVTLHDPCNVDKGSALYKMARYLINATCKKFVEMHPNREHSYCCCAGAGVINCSPHWKMKQMHGSKIKARQLAATHVETVIAPCHSCYGGLEDVIRHYKLGMNVRFLSDILYECIEKPRVVIDV